MKKVRLGVVLAVVAIMAACTNKDAYRVRVTAPDYIGGKAFVVYVADSMVIVDSVMIDAKGEATLKGERTMPLYCQLLCHKDSVNDKFIPIILEAGKITVDASKDSVGGTEKNALLQSFMNRMNQYLSNEEALYNQYFAAAQNEDAVLCATIEERYDKAQAQKVNAVKEFIREQNQNAVGAAALYMNFKEFTYMIEPEELIAMVENGGEEFLAQPQMAEIVDYANRIKKVLPGNLFTDVEMMDTKGEKVRLSNFVGKKDYLVIDFWASWCGPCRRSMPELEEIYSTYGKQIDILGISLDTDDEKWIGAIEKLQLPWYQMSDLKGWQCEGARIYCVNAIPHLMLIDKEGKIVARGLYDESLKEMLEELIH